MLSEKNAVQIEQFLHWSILLDPKSIDYSVPIYFGYTEKRELCNILMEETEKRILANDIRISEVGAVIGTHAGPNCCVLTYLSN